VRARARPGRKDYEMASASDGPRLLVVGDPFFLDRHRPLVLAFRDHFGSVDELAVVDRAPLHRAVAGLAALVRGDLRPPLGPALRALRDHFEKRPETFARKSRATARRIAALAPAPDVVLQLFGMSSPRAPGVATAIPYAHYTDFTMALVARDWPAWAPYRTSTERARWLELEGASYRGAIRAFGFAAPTVASYVADYGVAPDRAVAVGAAGRYDAVGSARTYGSRRIVFNGSDFGRKGGDLALAAFRLVRERVPDATLIVVGNAPLPAEPGVEARGLIPRPELFALLDGADVVLAPARADMLPGFVSEAMSRGCVPVLSDRPGVADAVRDGEHGIVVPLDAGAIASAVARLLGDPVLAERLGTAARARVARDWNWPAVAAKIAAELRAATQLGPKTS